MENSYTAAGVVALLQDDYERAIGFLEHSYEIQNDPVAWAPNAKIWGDHATLLGLAYLMTGDKDRGLHLAGETEEFFLRRIAAGDLTIRARVGLAAVHALRGDKDAAYEWLEKAIDAGFYQYAELEMHPCFESLHGEERFQQMMAGVKVRVEEMRRQVDALEVTR